MEPIDTSALPSEAIESNKKEKCIYKPIIVEDEDLMLDMARRLSPEQMVAFAIWIDYAMRLLFANTDCEMDLEPPKIIIHGKYLL